MQEIQKLLDSSFDQINNFIDQELNIDDTPISKMSNTQSEFKLPKVDQLNIIGQAEFISKIIKEVKPLIKSKMKDEVQIKNQSQHQQQSLINQQQSQQQFKQQNQIESPSQFNLKPFTYQIIQQNSIKQDKQCYAVAFNKNSSIVATGCDNQIKIYEFKQGILKLNQILNQHKTDVHILKFMKQSNQLISGDQGSILIWSYNNNSWICSQTIQAHNNWIRCLIMNNNEDLFISSSDDYLIKFWVKQNDGWISQQTITDHSNSVYQLSLNEQQNQIISCGRDSQILIIEQIELNKNWIVKQKIKVDCYGYRLCFINDNLFTFQPYQGNLMYVYEMNRVSKQFTKLKDITLNQSNSDDYGGLFPQQFIKQKQLLVNKHYQNINLIRFTQNVKFKVEQSIQFDTYSIYGQLSDDAEYLITWDKQSKEIQIRRFTEK
ncbi:unnamed protein product [Paramecium sonneborni]|uniref:WD40-repeat-containing domain n=1 Tax=Paramecium sonneborni TaxID=65129 RepID=A0A8S1RCW2_9CILI|nr:unnamed protein product [Paramecium sonneborni]